MNRPDVIVAADGKVYLVTGTPLTGYTLNAVELAPIPGRFQSPWQAKAALEQRTGGPAA